MRQDLIKFDQITTPPSLNLALSPACTTFQPPMRAPLHIVLGLIHLHVVDALYSGRFCPAACDFTLNYPTFNDTDPGLSKKVRSCKSELRITSLYLCFTQFCEEDSAEDVWLGDEILWCDEHADVTLPNLHDVVDNWTEQDIAAIKRLDVNEAESLPLLNELVLPDARFFEQAFTTMVQDVLCA
jgi:hypothetical protein